MSRSVYFVTHPNVVVSRDVPVPEWPLSELGLSRMSAGLKQPWMREVSAVFCSEERKAIDGARILAQHVSVNFTKVAELGENDRSATGFLPPQEFEQVADAFFAHPHQSVRGWERAIDAQERIVKAVRQAVRSDPGSGSIAIVSHGAVGTLLYCHLAGKEIDRRWDQPANGGGNFFRFTHDPPVAASWWRPIDVIAAGERTCGSQ